MTKRERVILENWDGRAAYWQYRHKPAEYEETQPHKRMNQKTEDKWILWLWILGTIGFLILLAKTTLWSAL